MNLVALARLTREKKKFEDRLKLAKERLQENRAIHAALMEDFENAVVNGSCTKKLQAKIDRIDKEFQFLEREHAALTKADLNTHLAPHAERVVEEGRAEMQKLHGRWALIKDKVMAIKAEYANLVAEAADVYREGDNLFENITSAQKYLPPPYIYISSPGDRDVNPERLQGFLFWENDEIYKIFTGKERRK